MRERIIYQGESAAFGQSQLTIELNTNIKDFNGWSAVVRIGGTDYSRAFGTAQLESNILQLDYNAVESRLMQAGFHEITITFTDKNGNTKTVLSDTILEVRSAQNA
jgi:hypothetical protein